MHMEWFYNLLNDTNSVAHIVMLYAFVISAGVLLGKIKVFGISLGVTFVLFVGILAGHFGFTAPAGTLNFLKEFGLILFVFSIGMQVGPSFFSSFKKGGLRLNLLTTIIILLNIAIALILFFAFNGRIELPMIVGIMFGAVTNTPGLGSAQEALNQIGYTGDPIALGYAVAYPLGVIGIILAIIIIRYAFKIDFAKEEEAISHNSDDEKKKPHAMSIWVSNESICYKKISELPSLANRSFVITRLLRNGHVSSPGPDTELMKDDTILVVCSESDAEAIITLIGREVSLNWEKEETPMISRRIIITKSEFNGKKLSSLNLRSHYGITVTRVNRSGIDLFANPNLVLQMGDRVTVVGSAENVKRVAFTLGNSMKRLNEPNIATIFIGIFLGIIFGSLPFTIPGIPTPVKLGLAGGPLIIAILIGRFGYKFNLVTYTTQSANLMLREVGITIFLASVGIGAGADFFDTVVKGDGLLWVACGFLITFLPLLIVGIFARKFFKTNYFILAGLIAGTYTDPPALAYANQLSSNSAPAIGYSTVYPLAMFLRVISGQIIILSLTAFV